MRFLRRWKWTVALVVFSILWLAAAATVFGLVAREITR